MALWMRFGFEAVCAARGKAASGAAAGDWRKVERFMGSCYVCSGGGVNVVRREWDSQPFSREGLRVRMECVRRKRWQPPARGSVAGAADEVAEDVEFAEEEVGDGEGSDGEGVGE